MTNGSKKKKKIQRRVQKDVANILKTGDKSVPEISGELEKAEIVIYR
jgi:hypothetical protein